MPSYRAGSGAPSYVEAGEYSFEVVEAIEKESSNRHPMIALVLEVAQGTQVYDYLVFAPKARCIQKIDDFRAAIGQSVVEGEEYDLEASDCLGAEGKVRLILGATDKGAPRNEVAVYLPKGRRTKTTAPVPKSVANKDLEQEPEDIPF